MRRPGGYIQWSYPAAPSRERDTFTCCHCNAITIVEPKSPPEGGHCKLCDELVCKRCAARGRCEPFEKKLLAMERRARLRLTVTGS